MSLGKPFPDMSLSSLALRVRTNSRPMSDAMSWASWIVSGPGEVSLEGTGVALYAVQPGVYVRMTRPLLLDKGLELDRELKQFLAQNGLASRARGESKISTELR